jgi:hypothetical protein
VSRAISELIRLGVVEKDLRRLIIRKPDVLRALVETEAPPPPPDVSLQIRVERRVQTERRELG